MAQRPDTETLIRQLLLDPEVRNALYRRNFYIGALEGGYIGLVLTGALFYAIRRRKK